MNPCNKFYPLYHSLQFLLTASFLLLLAFFIACRHFHSHPPGIAPNRLSRLAPIPSSSVCTSLDHLAFTFIFNPKSLIPNDLRIHCQTSSILIFCLLLLAGDVQINPGPVPVIPLTLKLATFNIRSASSITDLYNKPKILKHIIHDHQIDILCLSENWLDLNSLPATINSFLPPSSHFLTALILKVVVEASACITTKFLQRILPYLIILLSRYRVFLLLLVLPSMFDRLP